MTIVREIKFIIGSNRTFASLLRNVSSPVGVFQLNLCFEFAPNTTASYYSPVFIYRLFHTFLQFL